MVETPNKGDRGGEPETKKVKSTAKNKKRKRGGRRGKRYDGGGGSLGSNIAMIGLNQNVVQRLKARGWGGRKETKPLQ